MKLNLYAIFDTASGVYDGPFKCRSDPEAIRTFRGIATDADHPIGKNPEDFHLARVGSWNDNKGELVPETPEFLATALECVADARNVVNLSDKEILNA